MLLVAATVLPPIVFFAARIALDYRTDYDAAVGATQATSKALAGLLDRELSSALGMLSTLAASRALAGGDLAAFHDEAVAAARNHSPGWAIGLGDATGRLVLHTDRPFGASFEPRADLPYMKEVLASGRSMISGLFQSSILGQPVVAAYVPVLRDGKPVQVLAARLTLDNIAAILREQALPEGGIAAVIDAQGTIVGRNLRQAEVAGKPANPTFVAAVRAAPEGHIELVSREGVPIVVVWNRSPVSGWTASISMPKAQLTAPLIRDMVLLASTGLLALGLGLLAAVLLARRIERPLTRLAAAAALLDRGGQPEAPASGIAEVDGVGAALAGAAQRLRRRDAERDAFESRQRLLLAELDHRVKNTLAGIQAIARQSLPAGEPREAFIGRVQALAGAHAILGQAQWHGAALARLVGAAVDAYAEGPGRIAVAGPELVLGPKAAQALTLVLHELATNAAKYGALSTATGRLEVGWQVQEGAGRRLTLRWRERGGPPVRPPTRHGFGSRLITHTVRHDLEGAAELRYPAEGLECDIAVPLDGFERGRPADPAAVMAPAPARPEAGRRILVVEDSAWLAAELAALLGDAGYRVVGPVATLEEALAIAEREPLDGAVLDVNLDGKTVFPAAALLRRRGVPFVFLTGYGTSFPWPPEFAGVPRLSKPLQPAPLLAALSRAAA
ncbi:MAG: HWE histidine kinase domain-containing protein [Dongiaceae bacterium]